MPSPAHTVRVGPFQLDLRAAELHHNGTIVKLPDQPFQVLCELVEHPGEVVTREELRQRLWRSDTFVDFEHGLNAAVKRLRELLDDSAEKPRYIETLPRRGYRLMVPVEEEPVAVAVSETKARPQKLWFAVAAVVVIAAGLAGVVIWRQHPRHVHTLTPSDTIVIADFSNSTGDAVFDDALKQGLTMQLEQSPFLNIVSQRKVQDTLRLMERSADERLTPELGRELCERVGAKALTGSIARLGNQYVIGLSATACSNGDLLAMEQTEAANKEEVLKALGKAASDLRRELGESLGSLKEFNAPIESVTTSSLEALKAYSLGAKALSRVDFLPASAFFQRAIMLDSNFAMAYGKLATIYLNTGEIQHATENIEKAYELRDRVSDRERLALTAKYQIIVGDLEAARRTCEMWAEMYPRDSSSNLGNIYAALGDHEKALASFQESLQRDPTPNDYGNLVEGYLNLNRLEEAQATAREAQARHFDTPYIHLVLYLVAFVGYDAAGVEREMDILRKSEPLFQRNAAREESDSAAFVGQFAKARELSRRAVSFAERKGHKELAVGLQAWSALPEALVGNLVVARRQAKAALALSKAKGVEVKSACALGLAGDTIEADRLASDLARGYPQDTLMRSVTLPTIRAIIALQSGVAKDRDKAIAALAATAPYEFSTPDFTPPLFHIYIRGLAYLDANQAPSAVIEFQKILDHPGIMRNSIIGALAHLQLGRAYAMSGETTKAKAAYQDFLTLWKDADPDIPILKQAKAEYAKLR